jgi:DNA-binding beta-propeller fold protein YncE
VSGAGTPVVSAVFVTIASNARGVWVGMPSGVARLDPATGRLREVLPVSSQLVRITTHDREVWVLRKDPMTVERVDGGVRRRLRIPGEDASFLAAGQGSLWATVRNPERLVRVDPDTLEYASAAIGPSPGWLAPSRDRVWVVDNGSNTISAVDPRSLRPRDVVRVPLNPYAATATGGSVWVTSTGENVVARVARARAD